MKKLAVGLVFIARYALAQGPPAKSAHHAKGFNEGFLSKILSERRVAAKAESNRVDGVLVLFEKRPPSVWVAQLTPFDNLPLCFCQEYSPATATL